MSDQPAARRVTAADVARSLGISRATVGFVLNDTPGQTISPKTRTRVLTEAARLGYRPHLAARALASGRSRIVLLVLPDWPIDFTMRSLLDEVSLALDESGYSLVTMTPHAGGQARPLWETLQPDVVMGMAPFTEVETTRIQAWGSQVISPGHSPAGIGDDLDFQLGPELQIRHLADQGHSNIAFATTGDPRLALLGVERNRLAQATAEVLNIQFRSGDVDEGNVHGVLDHWVGAGVTGVAAYNDDIAALLLGTALRSGLQVPGQLAVIGHDDSPIASRLVPSMSSIRVDPGGLGRYFAALALHAIEGSPAPRASPATRATLVHRESS